MATSVPPVKPDNAAQPDPFQQPALANALMVGKTFTKLAPPGQGGGPGRPAYPAQRGEGFQGGPQRKPTATERIRSQQAARKAGPQAMPEGRPLGGMPMPAPGVPEPTISSTTGTAVGKLANPFRQV